MWQLQLFELMNFQVNCIVSILMLLKIDVFTRKSEVNYQFFYLLYKIL